VLHLEGLFDLTIRWELIIVSRLICRVLSDDSLELVDTVGEVAGEGKLSRPLTDAASQSSVRVDTTEATERESCQNQEE
tara:strand:- start:12766 stop:13002 length:237 start_codon:yes stop_codon:yes gene_type:complete